MFAFFKNDSLENFWSNQIGDVFFELTIKGMKWNQSQIDLNYYPELENVPAFYDFDQEKKLIIKNEIISFNDVVTQNELGEDVTTQEEVRTYVVAKIIEPIVYVDKGVIIKLC